MKLRTLSHFEDAIDKEVAWRKQELTTIWFSVDESRKSKVQVPLRSGLTLLYAHWEGWIKQVSKLYIQFVSNRGLKYSELNEAFLGIALRVEISGVHEARSARTHNEFASFVISDGLNRKADLDTSVIRTEGNLTSTVLEDIVRRLGLSYDPFELSKTLIDSSLVASRNTIAHGEYIALNIDSFRDLYIKIRFLLDTFTDAVLVAAQTGAYKRDTAFNR